MRLALLALLALVPVAGAQTTWYVDVNGTPPGTGTALDPYTSIDFALAQPTTLGGDLVLVLPGTYPENVRLNVKGVSVVSTAGALATVIDGGATGSAFSFVGSDGTPMLLDGFTLRNGSGELVQGERYGGGIYAYDAILTIQRCVVEQNDASQGGGLYLDYCVAKILRTRVRDNFAVGGGVLPDGAGLVATGPGSTLIGRCTFRNNTAGDFIDPGAGGAIINSAPNSMSIRATRIEDNTAERRGGGILGDPIIHRSLIAGNRAQFGGGIDGAATVTSSLIEGNFADSTSGTSHFGGGVFGASVLTDCALRDNTAYGEGAAANGAVLTRCDVYGNLSGTADGFITSGAVESCTLYDCNVLDNQALGTEYSPAQGGGASNSDLIDCDVYQNTASSPVLGYSFPVGGGVYGGTLDSCRVFDNFCGGYGGGVADATVVRTEIYGNSAQFGGGCLDSNLERTTVCGNSATSLAGGLYAFFGNSTVIDSILWNNGLQEVFVEPAASLSLTYSDILGGWAGTGNIDADPLFWNEAAGDYFLRGRSPCIDAGDPTSPTDPDGSRADMGAHPYDPGYVGS